MYLNCLALPSKKLRAIRESNCSKYGNIYTTVLHYFCHHEFISFHVNRRNEYCEHSCHMQELYIVELAVYQNNSKTSLKWNENSHICIRYTYINQLVNYFPVKSQFLEIPNIQKFLILHLQYTYHTRVCVSRFSVAESRGECRAAGFVVSRCLPVISDWVDGYCPHRGGVTITVTIIVRSTIAWRPYIDTASAITSLELEWRMFVKMGWLNLL